jgi:hypothetical protein
MPLFFIFAIAAGGIPLGAVTVDVTSDTRAAHSQAQAANFDPSPLRHGGGLPGSGVSRSCAGVGLQRQDLTKIERQRPHIAPAVWGYRAL